IEKKKREFADEMAGENKPEEIKQKIVEGKVNKWLTEVCLTKQAFIKNEEQTIEQLLNEKVAKIGEKIVPTRFYRLQMSAPSQSC
ncbi:MAG TPA: elongation factor Ts, partial [Patescibacteria group bacterium]|nr:elongation factor Ts [Patescibacteria group bacterium]